MFKRYKQRKADRRDARLEYYREEYRSFDKAQREAYRWSMLCWAASTFFRNREIVERCAATEDVCLERS